MDNSINLIKLCVGAEKVDDLLNWQKSPRAKGPDGLPRHVTRMWPKKSDALLNGGSIYWVFKGVVLARQHILRLDEVMGPDGITRCGIVLDPKVYRTEAVPKRPFQGWRYLRVTDAPRDLPEGRAQDESVPPRLLAALAEIGVR
ncbi:MAG: DUF1489 domain-containing protein [Pseudomonadota bacterium]